MEVIAFIAVCFVIYKIIDSNNSSKSREVTTHEVNKTDKNGRVTTTRTITSVDRTSVSATTIRPAIESTEYPDIKAYMSTEPAKPLVDYAKPVIDSKIAIPHRPRETAPNTQKATPDHGYVTKKCGKCKKSKRTSDFYHSEKNQDGFTKWCKSCLDNNPINPTRYKVCSKCNQQREKWNFFKADKQPDGLSKWCKPCHKKYAKSR